MYDDYYYYYLRYMIGSMMPWLIIAAVVVIAMWKIFKKANRPGWAAIVPIYNMYTLYDIVWGSGIKFLLLLIPIYNIILGIQTNLRLAKAFGKDTGFGVGLVLLNPIFMIMLGFGKAEYIGVDGATGQGTVNSLNNVIDAPKEEQMPAVNPEAKPVNPPATADAQEEPQEEPQTSAPAQEQTEAPYKKGTFCPKCGAKTEGGKFCPKCGNPMKV